MAARVRRNGRILCAATHPAEPGDTYLDDGIHYRLSVELEALVSEPMDPDPANPGRGGHRAHAATNPDAEASRLSGRSSKVRRPGGAQGGEAD